MGTLVFQATLGGAVNIIGPNIANTINFTLPSADGTSGQTWTTNGSGLLTFGTLGVAGGGTGLTTLATGSLSYGAGTSAFSALAIGTAGQVLTVNSGATAPQWSTLTGVAVTTFSAGTTGFTPSSATSGAVTLAGTLATTNGGTGLTAFTANQVFYASSTSAFAQSANLTFNGTTLTANTIGAFTLGGTVSGGGNQINNVIIGTSTPLAGAFTSLTASTTLGVTGVSTLTGGAQVTGSISGYGGGEVRLGPTTSAAASAISTQATGAPTLDFAHRGTSNTGTFNWLNGTGAASQLMTLTNTGLGVGTSSPSAKLDVAGTSAKLTNQTGADSTVQIGPDTPSATRSGRIGFITSSTQKNWYIANNWNATAAGGLEFTQTTAAGGSTMSTTPSMLLDLNGNLGLGVVPQSAWSGIKAFQIGSGGALLGDTGSGYRARLSANTYFDGSSYRYIASVAAGLYTINGNTGSHIWSTGSTGTAGNVISSFADVMTLDVAGGLKTLNTIGVGNATPSTSGAGITFPATQSASSDANTLDDYEEGTWTPTLNFNGGTTGITYAAVRSGRYTKVGRIVTVSFAIILTSKGSSTGNANISGLPFASFNNGGACPAYVGTLVGEDGMTLMPTGTYCMAWSDSSLYLRSNGASSFSALSNTTFTNTSAIYGTITYEVT
jgi:hypothetical protein